MVVDKGKKTKVGEKGEEENAEHIDGDLVLSIEKLQEIQDDLEKINEEASDKVLEVEQKYNEIRKPVYEKRNQIIKSIPDFWLTAFLSHPALGDLVTEEDQKNFGPNPYFEDTKLTKTFTFLDEGTTKITATSIKWKEGMVRALCSPIFYGESSLFTYFYGESCTKCFYFVKGIPNGVAYEKKGNKRPHADESFFTWFSETQQKDDMEEIQDEDADEEDFDGEEGDEE
ncbi:hypothetical protein U1Q18_048510, partial [Sarracenia purpurea var. burkii]